MVMVMVMVRVRARVKKERKKGQLGKKDQHLCKSFDNV